MEFVSMHAAAQSTSEDLRMAEVDWIPAKLKQALEGRLDIRGSLNFLETYVFDGSRTGAADHAQLRAAMQFLLQVCHAGFRMNKATSPTVRVPFGNQTVDHPAHRSDRFAIGTWFKGVYLSLIARAESLRQHLVDGGVYRWMMTEDVYGPFFQSHYLFLVELGTEAAIDEYTRAAKVLASIPPTYRITHDIYFPVWRPVLEMDQVGFDAALREAFQQHKAYWGTGTPDAPDRMHDAYGHRSIELTAIMAYAHDQGLKINLGSDYTPMPLVKGDILVDIDTPLDFHF